MPLNSDISCSSVHKSVPTCVFIDSALEGVCNSSTGCSTVSPEGVEAALAEKRGFFLGGIVMVEQDSKKIVKMELFTINNTSR